MSKNNRPFGADILFEAETHAFGFFSATNFADDSLATAFTL